MKRSLKKQSDSDQLTLLSLAHLARTSPPLAEEQDWTERVATWHSDWLNLLMHYGPAGCFSRTSLACCPPLRTLRQIRIETFLLKDEKGSLVMKQTKEATSDVSLPHFQNAGILELSQVWTLNTSGWRNGGSVCSLYSILEDGSLPRRYYLTSKACKGIQRRAEKRGKQLPTILQEALRIVAGA